MQTARIVHDPPTFTSGLTQRSARDLLLMLAPHALKRLNRELTPFAGTVARSRRGHRGCAGNRPMALLARGWRFTRPPLQLLTLAACTVLLAACGSTAVTSTGPSVISKCGLTLGAPESAIGPSGGSGQVVLTTTPECAWTASADASWVTRIEPSSGQGSGTLRVDVAPNPSRAPRQTTILVNGVRVQIQQAAVPLCVYGVTGSGSQSVAGSGDTFQLTVSTADGCTWTATSPVPWVTVNAGSPGNGPGVVEFTVERNDGSERDADLVVAGQSFTVAQAASGSPAAPPSAPPAAPPSGPPSGSPPSNPPVECTYALSPVSLGMPATAGGGSVTLTTACAWTGTANVPWITLATPSGTGSATVGFAVAVNTGDARSGTIRIGTATTTITQAAAPLIATYAGTASGTQNFDVAGALSLAPGTYTMTFSRAFTIYVRGVAGGGGGGGGKRRDDGGSSTGGGGGGGGGAANLSGQQVSVVSGTTYEAVVGTGGSGGTGATQASGNNSGNGTAGTQTYFRIQGSAIYLQLAGGSGGSGGTITTGIGGAGGTVISGVGVTGGVGGNGGGEYGLVAPQPGGGTSGVSTGGGGGGGQSNEQSSTAGGAQGGQGGASGGAGGSGAKGGNAGSGSTDSGAGGEGARDNNGDDSAGGGGGGGKGVTAAGGPSNRGGGGGGGGALNTGNSADRAGDGGAGGNGGMSIGIR